MEERTRVEYYKGSTIKEEGDLETFICPIDDSHVFLGKEVAVSKGFKLVYYFVPFRNNDAILLLCIDENAELTKAFEDYSQSDLNVLSPSFPKTIQAICDGNNANLTNYAIIRLDSNGHEFDCVATKITNIDLSNLETEYLIKKVCEMACFATEVENELDWDRVSFWQKVKIIAHGVKDGAQTALKIYKIENFLNKVI